MQEDLVRWERAISEGIDIPSTIKAESDFYRLDYDELIKMCNLSKLHDQDYYSVCSHPGFWKRKLEYDISQRGTTYEDFLLVSLERGWTIYVGILLSLVDPKKILNKTIFDVVEKGYYNIVKLLLNDERTKFFFINQTKPISIAVIKMKNDIAFLLINNIKLLEDDYVKILMAALRVNNIEIINYILDMNLNFTPENMKEIFDNAGASGNIKILELLEKSGFPLEGDNLNNALIGASWSEEIDMMNYLLDLDADPTYNSYEAFWEAFNNYSPESIKVLLETGKISDEQIQYTNTIINDAGGIGELGEILKKYI